MPVSIVTPSLDDFYIRAALAPDPGQYFFYTYGRNPDVDTGAPEDIWNVGGLWVPPTAARIHDIVSDDANDTAAGTGAQQVRCTGLDANYLFQEEFVTLNGVTNVPTVNTFIRLHELLVPPGGFGAGGGNAGTITATAQTDATIQSQIDPGQNISLSTTYTVPADKRAAVSHAYASIIKAGPGTVVEVFFYGRLDAGAWIPQFYFGLGSDGTSTYEHDFDPPPIILPKTDLRMLVDVSAVNTIMSGGYELTLFNDPDYTPP